jgi:lysophospholipase L1-like esterase
MILTKPKSLLVICLFLMVSILSAQDWAQLGHFDAANKELPDAKTNENRVVFMGNSITIGWSHHQPEFFEGKPYVNRGISGQTTPQMLVRFRQDVIDLKPKVVVILAGTNDIAGNTGPSTLQMIADNIMSMAELAEANGIKVVLCSVLPAYDYPWRKGLMPNEKIPALNTMIKSYVNSKGLVYLDYFSAMTDGKNGLREDLGSDGVHPNKKGYELMAPLAEKAITKAIGN